MTLLRALVSCLFITLAGPVLAQPVQPPASFADIIDKLSPAVVNISTTQKMKGAQGSMGLPFQDLPDTPELEPFRDFFERFGQPQQEGEDNGDASPDREVYSLGSGFIIDAKGFVITNNHVIADAEEITVTFSDNTKYKAKIIGRDKKTDLALLKIEAKKDLPFVTLGDSDKMRVGDWVLAVGNPFGLGGTVTQGIISARQRNINAGPFDDFFQTDAPINRGNSGGPLFNTNGEVIGIATAIFSPNGGSIGIGFAIPTALARPVIDQLKQYGRTHRGWLGVKIQEVSEEVAESIGLEKAMGALVIEVAKDSPAGKAGLLAGDIITSFDGHEIKEMRFLPRMVAETPIGKTVTVAYWRKGASKTAQIKVGELDEQDVDGASDEDQDKKTPGEKPEGEKVMGMQVAPITPQLRTKYKLEDNAEGLMVLGGDAKSEASKRGIHRGDLIVDVNGEKVKTAADLRKAFEEARKAGRKFALLKISRAGEDAFVTLPTEEKKEVEKPKN